MAVQRTKVLLADDPFLLPDLIKDILRKDFEVVGIAKDGRMIVKLARQLRPDVIVADVAMPNLDSIGALRILRQELPATRVLFLSPHNDVGLLRKLFQIGANGFVLKTDGKDELVTAIQAVARGETYITPALGHEGFSTPRNADPRNSSTATPLTPRKRELLRLLGEGKTVREAAIVMGISSQPVEWQKYDMMRKLRKLGVTTTAPLIRFAIRHDERTSERNTGSSELEQP
jgi:DNA-binding NarL/FixJ family response regulator